MIRKARNAVGKFLLHDRSGAAMVEFALVSAVVFLPLVFGVIEFGRGVWAKTTVTAAAREGVRYAIVHGKESGFTTTSTTVSNAVKARTQLSPITVTATWKGDQSPGDTVTVTVTYSYVPVVTILPSKTITSTSKQIVAY